MGNRHTIISELMTEREAALVASYLAEVCQETTTLCDGHVVAGYASGWQINADNNPIPLDWLFAKLQHQLPRDVRFSIITSDDRGAALTVKVGPSGIKDLRRRDGNANKTAQSYTVEELVTNVWRDGS